VAFAVRVCSIWSNLPLVPNPDEYLIVWPPLRMAYGTWYASGGYPPLYMYIMLVEYGVFYVLGALAGRFAEPMDFARQMIADPTLLYLMGRATSVLLGTATVLALYAVGRRLYDGRVALLAAAFLTFDTVHVYASQVMKNDVLMVFLLILSFWFVCGILQEGRTRHYVLAGLLAGIATAAKYNGAIAVLPIVGAHLLRSRARGTNLVQTFLARPLWLAGLCTVGGFLLGYPTFLLDPGLAWNGLRTNSVDFFWAWLGWEGVPLGWIYYPSIALYVAWGLPLQLLALGGLIAALIRRRPADLLLSVLPLVNYLMMGSVRVNQPRYLLLGMPFLLVLAARLLVSAIDRVRLPDQMKRALLPVGVALLVAWPAGMSFFQDYMLLQPHPWVTARAWIDAHVPASSRVVLDMGGPPLPATPESLMDHYGPPKGHSEEVRREVVASRSPTYWVLPIQHYIRGQPYLEGREATVQPLDWYRAHGYEYIVISSMVYNSYHFWPGVAERYPRTMAFYDEVAHEAELLAEFKPVVNDPRGLMHTDINVIPTIRVYRLSAGGVEHGP
jgi:hypothetical protein